MPVPTGIDFKDFLKAVPILARKKGFIPKFYPTRGSAIRFELFNNKTDTEPAKMWVVHEDKREKKVYSDDLKKACKEIGVSKKDFEDLIKRKFKL